MSTKSYWERFQRERISRRRLLAVAGTSAAGLAVVVACGGGDEGPDEGTPGTTGTPQTLGTPVRGGRYKDAEQVEFDNLDPVLGIANSPTWFPRMYNVLVNQASTKPEFIINDLAEEYEAPEPGGVEWIFTIRPGVKIAPNTLGVPERDLDAEDARVAFERMRTDEGANAGAFTKQWIDSMTASADRTTFTIKTKGPYAYFLFRIGLYVSTIFPREFAEQDIDMAQQGVGAGPFVLVPGSFVPSQGLKLDRNPNYYRKDERTGEQLPYIDGIDVSVIPDRGARRTAFLSQQIHNYTAENIGEANELLAGNSHLYQLLDPNFFFIAFTMNPTKKPWDDPRIRKAANLALNRQDYVDRIEQGEGAPNGLVHWPLGAYALPPEELEQLQPYQPEESKRLIREATGQDTITVKVMYPANTDLQKHNQVLPIWLQQMEAAGFVIEKEPEAFATWLTRYTQKQYDASLSLNQAYESPDIPLDFHHSKGPIGDGTYVIGVGALEPEVDKAIEDHKKVTNPEELVAAVHDVQRLIYEKGPAFLPIYSWYDYRLFWDFVKNWPEGLPVAENLVNTWWLEGAT